jgi:FAD/FMN-containing dehydrogenase
MRTIRRRGRTYHLPATEEELCQLVRRARDEGCELRVRGSGHSFPPQIHRADGGRPALLVLLDDYCEIERWHEDPDGPTTVTVQAGCRLTHAPRARGKHGPGDLSQPWWRFWPRKGLLQRMHHKGLALADLGGITHQTVAGFVSTGSAGGSVKYPMQVCGFRIIDADGNVEEVSAERNPELFHAAGTSMGLLGVISAVTFQCDQRYYLRGNERIVPVDRSPIDLFGDGEPGDDGAPRPTLETFLRDTDYTRLLWWPQPDVQKLTIWEARRLTLEDFRENPKKYGTPDHFRRRPYVEIGMPYYRILRPNMPVIGLLRRKIHWVSSRIEQMVASRIYRILGQAEPAWYLRPFAKLVRKHAQWLLNTFNPEGTQEFWDIWWKGLPMDNQIDDYLMPTWFTEIWIPIEQTQDVMRTLRDMYEGMSLEDIGYFCVEIYAGAPEPFWLHPSGNRETVRIDFFWFGYNDGDPREYFQRFWDVLARFQYRGHLGKYVPQLPADKLDALYPELPRFRQLCRERDPHGIFRTDYWREHLHLDAPAADADVQAPQVRHPVP